MSQFAGVLKPKSSISVACCGVIQVPAGRYIPCAGLPRPGCLGQEEVALEMASSIPAAKPLVLKTTTLKNVHFTDKPLGSLVQLQVSRSGELSCPYSVLTALRSLLHEALGREKASLLSPPC